MEFILEAEKMKNIYRQTFLVHEDRTENDAEHSWHLALMLPILAEHADFPADLLKTIRMVLIHDIVEIDAGDTYCYDYKGYENKREREEKAADRLFGLLPLDQESEFRAIWEEFEENETPEANLANAMDRLQPLLLNIAKGGISWKNHEVKYEQVAERMLPIKKGSYKLWEYVMGLLDECCEKGMLPKE